MKKYFCFQLCCVCMLSLILASCKVKKPDGVLPESTMENVLYDYHIAKAMGDNLPYSENYKKALYVESVFNKYGTTEEVFDSSMVWYTRNTDILAKIYERVTKRLKTKQDAINHLIAIRDKRPTISVPGDSIDVWAWKRMARLSGMPMDNKLTFVMPSDSNFKERDTLVWQARYHFLQNEHDSVPVALMTMQILFENDSIITNTRTISHSGIQTLRLQSDTLGIIKEVKGFIYYPGKNSSSTLLVDRMMLTRYHSNDSIRVSPGDSIGTDSAKIDDSRKRSNVDSIKMNTTEELQDRLSPEEMNRRRTNMNRTVKPEQIEVEKHILQEKNELRKERQMNNQRRQQLRTNQKQ